MTAVDRTPRTPLAVTERLAGEVGPPMFPELDGQLDAVQDGLASYPGGVVEASAGP